MWAPDYLKEFNRRLEVRNKCLDNLLGQEILKAHYTHSCVDWINDFAVTFDPRNQPPIPRLLPFILFPRQVEFVHFILGCLNDKESGLVEKSRDMGATWLCCAISVWLFLYRPGTVVGWGSRKESYVDKMGDPKAIFPKIRQLLENLPPWMLPRGFRMNTHANYMRIVNPDNLCAIIGEAGESMGRGGRTSIYFKDESAHYEHPESVEAALGDNTDVQIDMSSVNGSANVFYRRRMAGEVWHIDKPSTPGKTRVFIFDWKENPLKTDEWYLKRRAKAEAEGMLHIFAQEVDRNYAGSVAGIVIKPEWITACVDAHIKLGWKPSGMKVAGQDIADGGGDKNALAIVHGNVLRFCDHWAGEAGDAAYLAVPTCANLGVKELYYDSVGVGAGFKTGINTLRNLGSLPRGLRVMPWNGGAPVLDPEDPIIPGDPEAMTNEEMYENLKAQAWFRMRTRVYKTYRAVMHGEQHPPEELMSIDSTIARLHELCMEMSQPVHKASKKGKTMIDKKPEGASSPNLADAVIIAYSPTREVSIFDVLTSQE